MMQEVSFYDWLNTDCKETFQCFTFFVDIYIIFFLMDFKIFLMFDWCFLLKMLMRVRASSLTPGWNLIKKMYAGIKYRAIFQSGIAHWSKSYIYRKKLILAGGKQVLEYFCTFCMFRGNGDDIYIVDKKMKVVLTTYTKFIFRNLFCFKLAKIGMM